MNRRTTILATLVVVAVIAAVVFAPTMIRHFTTSKDTGHDSQAHIDPLDPAGADPSTVAVNALTVAYSWQPATDRSSWDALHRALPLLTAPAETFAQTPPVQPPPPLPQWSAWAAAGDTITAAARAVSSPGVDHSSASVTVTVTQSVLHRDASTTPLSAIVVDVQLVHIGDTWKVAKYVEAVRK